MKRFFVLIILVTLTLIIFLSGCTKQSDSEIIRIHIRANSNGIIDQDIKYLVKDGIVQYINTFSDEVDTKSDMYNLLNESLAKLESIANEILILNGMNYKSEVKLSREEFPVRDYEGITFPAGIYDSLIITLGEGKGNNWWCVAYPPLCFIGAEDKGEDYFTYKSKILEILRR